MIDLALQKVEHASTHIMYTGGAVAVTSGIWTWLDEHYRAIGAIGVLFGIAVNVAGYFTNRHYRRQQNEILRKKHSGES